MTPTVSRSTTASTNGTRRRGRCLHASANPLSHRSSACRSAWVASLTRRFTISSSCSLNSTSSTPTSFSTSTSLQSRFTRSTILRSPTITISSSSMLLITSTTLTTRLSPILPRTRTCHTMLLTNSSCSSCSNKCSSCSPRCPTSKHQTRRGTRCHRITRSRRRTFSVTGSNSSRPTFLATRLSLYSRPYLRRRSRRRRYPLPFCHSSRRNSRRTPVTRQTCFSILRTRSSRCRCRRRRTTHIWRPLPSR
mmetsp:Transcript_10413/g.22105  ORF Transcript_10413/g.22105 Transcript_10413/m.22105 type:complete len:250 (-) Transcript_10413:85-834(-)